MSTLGKKLNADFDMRELSPWEMAEKEAEEYEDSYKLRNDDVVKLGNYRNIPVVMAIW